MQRFRTEETATTASEAQYDSEAVREVLARAAAIEQSQAQARADRVSAEQIETLGRELGISPDAVRRALRERSAPIPVTSTRTAGSNRLSPLTKRDIKAAFVPGLWYAPFVGLFLSVFTAATRHGNTANSFWGVVAYILVFFMAPLIAGLYGWRNRDYRKGLIAGAATTILSAGVITAVLLLTFGTSPDSWRFFQLLSLTVGGGILVGAASGGLSRWWHDLRDTEER